MARVTTPYPPRLMTKEKAAEYCSMGTDLWERIFGKMLTPISYSKGVKLYDRMQMDRVIDMQSGLSDADDPALGALNK